MYHTTDEAIIAAYRKTPSIERVCQTFHVSPRRCRRVVRAAGLTSPGKNWDKLPEFAQSAATPEQFAAHNEPIVPIGSPFVPHRIKHDSFLSEFDIPAKVRAALADLGNDAILDNDLRLQLAVQSVQWANIRELPEFKANQLTHRDKRYWSSKETIARATQLRNQV